MKISIPQTLCTGRSQKQLYAEKALKDAHRIYIRCVYIRYLFLQQSAFYIRYPSDLNSFTVSAS